MPHPLHQVPPAARTQLAALIAKLPADLTISRVEHTRYGWAVGSCMAQRSSCPQPLLRLLQRLLRSNPNGQEETVP